MAKVGGSLVFNPVLSPRARLVLDGEPGPARFSPVRSPGSQLDPPAAEADGGATDGDGSLWSRDSVRSIVALGSAGSILSIGSAGSVLSIGSAGSILSIGSAGSILSIGSIGSVASIGSAFSVGALGGFACRPGRAVETAAGVLAVAALFAAAIRT